ncbi:MAG: dienelactone hydrolase family protein [Acidimicrobiia bacterium]|nr:dienelactone hydrolase family protein [Acidimicrobiia bacterium]
MRDTLPSGTPVEIERPDAAPAMGLVIAPDIGGLRPLFDAMARRLSSENGWAVAAVEPFPGRETMTIEERLAAMPTFDDAASMRDLVAAAGALDCDRVGILGFCMGGMLTLKAAATLRFDRAVPFYGMVRNPADWKGDGADADAVDTLKATPGAAGRVLAIMGTADPYTPAHDVDDLEAAGATVVRYEGAEHGFVHDADRPAHRADDAADAWRRAIAWLSGADA